MKGAAAVAEILKREGVEFLIGYPVNPVIEAAAEADIRTIIVRQERTGIHMADAVSRTTSGKRIGVFAMQFGPGTENSFGGVAQAFSDSVPVLILPSGYERRYNMVPPHFNAYLNFQHISKHCEQVPSAAAIPSAMRRAFTQVKNGHPRPVVMELPADILREEVEGPLTYKPVLNTRTGPDPAAITECARILVEAKRPVIYAGQGVHYAQAWAELKQLAELLEAPVTTSLQGKSAFDETHPLSLGSGGRSMPLPVHEFLKNSDVIFGIGASFTRTNYGITFPPGKTFVQSCLDETDLNNELNMDHAVLGDAKLVLQALIAEVSGRLKGKTRGLRADVERQIRTSREAWLKEWMPRLTSKDEPLSHYRVIWDLLNTVDVPNTIITHDAGSPRDQLSPFWRPTTPLSYIGWGKSTQLGYGLGLAMGAKLAHPDKLCINVWGDAAIGFTGMDFETAVRERIPILSILLNNFSMAIELKVMPVSTQKYRSTDISGHYANMAKAFGGYGERVERAQDIIPAIQRGIAQTKEGTPALLEFITNKEQVFSMFN